jgi:hypothetical protein
MSALISLIRKNSVLFAFLLIATILTIVLMLSGSLNREIKILKTVPEPGITYSGVPYGSIRIYFSEEIEKKSVKVAISPQTDIVTEIVNNKPNFFLKIYPKTYWEMNREYILTVNKSLSSVSGAKLRNDLNYDFSYRFPPGSEQQGVGREGWN